MQKIGLFFGSDTGTTADIAKKIQAAFGEKNVELFDAIDATERDISEYNNIIFGASTLGIGDIQGDFEVFLEEITAKSIQGKKVALFGLGDADGYADTFADSIGIIYEAIEDKGCEIIGFTSTDGYEYEESLGEKNNQFVGLVIDEDNQDDLTDKRIEVWVEELRTKFI